MMRIGRVIHKWRVASEIDQKALAKAMGISASTLCRLEQGRGCDAQSLSAVIRWLLEEHHETPAN